MEFHYPQVQPLVTVVIPVYNAGDYLRPSVMSIVEQTYKNLEILIIDDGSTDGCFSTIETIKDRRIRIIKQPHGGKPTALNRALEEMRGQFYVIQDADDISSPARIERQLQCMLENPSIAAVFCGCDLILNGRHVAPIFLPKSVAQCRRYIDSMRLPAHDPTAFYRVSMVQDLEYTLPVVDGLDYIMRVGERYPMMVLGDCLYSYRIHPDSITKQNVEFRERMAWKAHRLLIERRGLIAEQSTKKEVPAKARLRNKDKDNDLVGHFMMSLVGLRHRHRRLDAVRTALTCLRLHPLDPYYYKPLLYAFAPLSLIKFYRSRKGL